MASPPRDVSAEIGSGGLSLVDIRKRFGRVTALDGLSIHVDHGEVVGLFGRDGAGKTTCFEAAMGLTSIDSGRIVMNGRDITKLTLDRRAPLGLSYLAQETSIFRGMTTAENISAVLEHTEPDMAARSERLDDLLDRFSIDYVRDTPTPRLSGGERRRCEVARAMASSPSIMLLDEPFAGIDPMSVASIRKTIEQLRGMDVGVLMADQNVHETIEVVDRTYVIHFGKLIFEGPPDEMLTNRDVRRFYLGQQYH
ncbi:MAG: LPS export ABC transporter ATP-binding protein [Novosphingobium sp.]|nr:LPS export ABC transporter ATP-binding protein [Novosphingobium sp.]